MERQNQMSSNFVTELYIGGEVAFFFIKKKSECKYTFLISLTLSISLSLSMCKLIESWLDGWREG